MRRKVVYLGIDPGIRGGIAAIVSSDGKIKTWARKMPASVSDLVWLLRRNGAAAETESFAMLERVHSSPQMGVRSAFTFGQGFGRLEAALESAGINTTLVRPQVWQKALGCLTGGNKRITYDRAAEMFPEVDVTMCVADALLLAAYCKQQMGAKT